MLPLCGETHGRYWARTSDHQLVDRARALVAVGHVTLNTEIDAFT
jgi:hypothetical protein